MLWLLGEIVSWVVWIAFGYLLGQIVHVAIETALREAKKMPIATITERTKHIDLRTCEGGYVVIKRMSHGEKLHRRSMTKMSVNAKRGKKDVQAEIDMMQKNVALWEFANLILEHNLETYIKPDDPESGTRLLNFKNPADVELLDGKIGEEIDAAISDFNNFELEAEDEDSDLGN